MPERPYTMAASTTQLFLTQRPLQQTPGKYCTNGDMITVTNTVQWIMIDPNYAERKYDLFDNHNGAVFLFIVIK
jgi:hypothetical protein